jgi:predicted molibdopterin-dependent oxidoreductase YjgC
MDSDLVKLTIDGREIKAKKGQTILEAAREHGIYIPSLCYHPRISRTGACRICIVRVNNTMLKTACTEPVIEEMKVVTEDEGIIKDRKFILELLLMEGDHNCLYCDANGDCELQSLVQRYQVGPVDSATIRNYRETDYDSSNALKRNEMRCILCGRCVKTCNEIQMCRVWAFRDRGSRTRLVADDDRKIGESSCVKCGQCAQMCPTGALALKPVITSGANWELTKESSICIYCGVGCKIDFYKNRDDIIVKALGNDEGPNQGHLCVKGRFGFDFVYSKKRLTKPMVRKNGVLEETSWEEALDHVAEKLSSLKGQHGNDAIGGLCSAKCTNEENYLFQKFMRAVIGTNNVDHCARL